MIFNEIHYQLRLIHYVFTKYDEPFFTKVRLLGKQYVHNIKTYFSRDLKRVGIEIEGGFY